MGDEGLTRRDLIAGGVAMAAAAVGAGIAVGLPFRDAAAQDVPSNPTKGEGKRWGMFIDARRCVDCGACLKACHLQNRLKEGMDFIRFPKQRVGRGGRAVEVTVPMQCMHCADAPCVAVCPTQASYIGEGGVVRVNRDRCIGCAYCVAACPYQARVLDHETGEVDKCRFCVVESQDSHEMTTSCVEACINNVRIFGDLNDPESEVSKAIVRYHAQPIAGDITDVSIFYRR